MRGTLATLGICLALVLLRGVCAADAAPPVAFHTRCLERHFWLSVESHVLGAQTRFAFEDPFGSRPLSDSEAQLCGYTILRTDEDALTLRASFLACHVHHLTGSDLHLDVWLVSRRPGGTAEVDLLRLRCLLVQPWSPREIVCEENYMEVSIQWPVLPQENQTRLAVMVHRAGQQPGDGSRVLSLAEASALGYHFSLLGPRLTLRTGYSSLLSYTFKDDGLDLEVVNATILYQRLDKAWAVDATVACAPLGQAPVQAAWDGSGLLWSVPHVLSPLVRGQLTHRGVRVAVDGAALSQADIRERGHRISLLDGRADVWIPAGARGARVQSGLHRGRYSQSLSADLILMSQWQDDLWPLTQHRSFRRVQTPLSPRTLVLSNYTVASQGFFSFALGAFASDVSLLKVAVEGGGQPLIWRQSPQTRGDEGLDVSMFLYPNGSHAYLLRLPFSHSKIIPEYLGGGHRVYRLSLTFTLSISPHGDVFHHRDRAEISVHHHLNVATLEGKCTESGLLVILHYGATDDRTWELYLGGHRLDWELAETGGFRLEAEEEFFSVEVPLGGPGMTYQELSLRSAMARVEASVLDATTLKLQDSLVHKCTFPVHELLACLPEGKMVAVIDTSHAVPPVRPNCTTLLDPSCVPTETDSARALFSFNLDSCGTTVTADGDFLVYENEVIYSGDPLPAADPLIHRDAPYRLTLRCRYPLNYSGSLSVQRALNATSHAQPCNGFHELRKIMTLLNK